MSWRKIVPSLFTMLAMMAGFFSMISTAEGEYVLAAQLIMLSMLMDGLDGTLARMLKGTTKFGAELDTYVDMTSFGLAPAFLLYHLVLKDSGILGYLVVSAYVLSGVSRLSRFRVVDPFRGQKGFLGLPITAAAGYTACMVIATQAGLLDDTWFSLTHGPVAAFYWSSTLIMLILQISHVRFSKPTTNPLTLIPFSIMLVILFARPQFAVAGALLLVLYGLYYAFISPFFYRHALLMAKDEDEEEEEEPLTLQH
ncbi:MAG: CDP-alcohol phosphatidyltransferase family protein [Lentisphaerota bacterium]